MKTRLSFVLLASFLAVGLCIASAQESMGPPKVLVITREFLKPGKGGSTHEKAESAFVQAFSRAKWPTHYLAMDSLSGKTRALFTVGYDSFEAYEKDGKEVQKNAALASALDHAAAVDGELLDSMDGGTFRYREDYSFQPNVEIAHMRYFEIGVYRVRQGHTKDWDDGVKMVLAAYQKSMPNVHFACYEGIYGTPQGTYLFITPMKSASEIDQNLSMEKQFAAAMGEDGMKKLDELSAAAIESAETNLFIFNPRMSYVSEEWIKADPDFWKPKPPKAAAAPKKAEEKAPPKQ